eukprot:6464954-Amphidinium_carterae.1
MLSRPLFGSHRSRRLSRAAPSRGPRLPLGQDNSESLVSRQRSLELLDFCWIEPCHQCPSHYSYRSG